MLFILVLCGCSKKDDGAVSYAVNPDAGTLTRESPAALIEVENKPVWVEFESNTLRQLDTPENAALNPFKAWPLAEYVVDMVEWQDSIVIAVNRGGFWLVKRSDDGVLELYFLTESKFTPSYTMHSVFFFQKKPVFLIYRNDFFGKNEISPPASRFFTIKDNESGLESINIPVFSKFSGVNDWDIEEIFDTNDGFWYFKAIRKDEKSGAVYYARTMELSAPAGEEITASAYMTAAMNAAEPGASDYEETATFSSPMSLTGLPPLPENFVYTSQSQINGIYITAWEERENWNIGAAGLLFTR